MSVRVYKTLAILVLSGVTGCASGPFHRKTVPPPALQLPPPELSQTPLYSPEMSEDNPRTPSLPSQQPPLVVVKEPEPPPKKPHKPHRPKTVPGPAKGSAADTDVAATPSGPGAGTNIPATASTTSSAVAEKKPVEIQQAKVGRPAPSPIGELTTGNSVEVAQTSRQTFDLIRTTREGAEAIKRALSAEEKKTMVEIGSFLSRADQALRNGDVDGAYGLATKAKILLDELTQN